MSSTFRRIVQGWVPFCLLLAVASPLAGAVFPESEPNGTKQEADPAFNMQPGDSLQGITIGNVVGPGNNNPNSADYFQIQTLPQPPGIYRYMLLINTPGPQGHTGTMRGVTQTGGVINPGTDALVQSSQATTVPPRYNQWYGFGRGERVFYSITGTPATNQPYNCTLNRQFIPTQNIGPFREGQITITTVGQGHATDTDLWVYDANLVPLTNNGNDDEPAPGLTLQSRLTRTYAPGVYFLALTDFNFANDRPSPPDDRFLNGNVMDFIDSAVNSSPTPGLPLNFAVTHAGGTVTIPATKAAPYDINWYRFEVHSFIPAADDCWDTMCGTTSYDFANTPIPCSFFDPGSEPFDGIVLLGGGNPTGADTTMRRLDGVTFPPALPSTGIVPIEIVSLNLVSCQPITVHFCTPQANQIWHVGVGLSAAAPPPPGLMGITKTHPNGGTFSSQFFVRPRFVFTREGDGVTRILDTGLEGIPPMFMDSADPAPWVHQATIPVSPPPCGINFVPGVQEANVPSPGGGCTPTTQCSKLVCHAGPGHEHCTGPVAVTCLCGACCNPVTGTCIEINANDPAATCAAQGGIFHGIGSTCSDNDGDTIPDAYETNHPCAGVNCVSSTLCASPTSPSRADTDGDGLSDSADPFPTNRCLPLGAPNRPAICDQFDLTLPGDGDCDNDGNCDLCEIESGLASDCNRNGIPDGCEPDCNGNGLPDDYDRTCGTLRTGDADCNNVVNALDVPPFVLALIDPVAYGLQYNCINNVDVHCDGVRNGLDIAPFVGCVMTGVCP